MKVGKPKPKTFAGYLRRLIKISYRCSVTDAHLLRKEEVDFHAGAHKAYKHALNLFKEYHAK